MTDTEQPLAIVRTMVETFNRGDRPGFRATLAHDAVLAFHGSQRICRGPEAILEAFWSASGTAGGAQWEIVNLLPSGPHVTVEYVRTYESAAAQRHIAVPECMVVTVRAASVATIRHYADRMTELVQLGALALGSIPELDATLAPLLVREVRPASGRALRRLLLRRDRHSTAPS